MVAISSTLVPLPEYTVDNRQWRHLIEDHLGYLKEKAKFEGVEPHDAYRFAHDLIAYLYHKGIHPRLHWIILRLNGYVYPHDFTEDTQYILYPDERIVDDLESAYTLEQIY